MSKVHVGYYTHATPAPTDAFWLWRLRERVKRVVLAVDFGYRHLLRPHDQFLATCVGKVLAAVPPLREAIRLSAMELRGPADGQLLEVGCGNGQDVVWMRELGWDACGVEPDPEAATEARRRLGVPIITGNLEDGHFEDARFAAIVMHHVIEHVHDPPALLRECSRVLKAGGRLAIITPNVESVGHRLFKTAWVSLESPRHLCLFSTRTLRTAVERAGLRVVFVRTSARWVRWLWPASWQILWYRRLLNSPPKAFSWWLVRAGALGAQVMLYPLRFLWHAAGDELVLLAEKPAADRRDAMARQSGRQQAARTGENAQRDAVVVG